MKKFSTYEIKFTTTSDLYKEKLQPFSECIKMVFAENKPQAVERACQKLMKDFPKCQKDIWEVKEVIKIDDNIFQRLL